MGTKYKGTLEEEQALNVFIKFYRASDSLTGYLNHHIDSYGLTESQFSTLESLYHLGPMCQGEIGAKILKSSGNMTMVIDNLEKQNLVKRIRDENDRRQYIIHFTEKGKELIEKIFPKHVEVITNAFGTLDSNEQVTLSRLLKKLGTKMPK